MKLILLDCIKECASKLGQTEIKSISPVDEAGNLISVKFEKFEALFVSEKESFHKYWGEVKLKEIMECKGDYVRIVLDRKEFSNIVLSTSTLEPVKFKNGIQQEYVSLYEDGVMVIVKSGKRKFHNWKFQNWAVDDSGETEFLVIKREEGKVFGKSCGDGEYKELKFVKD